MTARLPAKKDKYKQRKTHCECKLDCLPSMQYHLSRYLLEEMGWWTATRASKGRSHWCLIDCTS